MTNTPTTVILKYPEITLKGKNRGDFESSLLKNIKQSLNNTGLEFKEINRIYGKIHINTDKILTDTEINQFKCLETVFGLQYILLAYKTELDFQALKTLLEQSWQALPDFETFRVTVRRANKKFSMKSPQVERELGAFIVEKYNKKVSLKEFDFEVEVEIEKDGMYLIYKKYTGFNGLPTPTQGTVLSLIESEQDILATLLVMTRGCGAIPITTPNTPKDLSLDLLKKFSYGFTLESKQITSYDEIPKLAQEHKITVLITGQTLETLSPIPGITNLTPLIAYAPDQISKTHEEFKNAGFH